MKAVFAHRSLRKILRPMGALCATLLACSPALAADVWLGGSDPVLRHTSYKDDRPTDYMQLFEDNSPWQRAGTKVTVFKVYTQFVAHATDEELSKVFAGLKKRHIALAEETLMLPLGSNGCGKGIEGYLDPHGLQFVLDRIKRLGGELRYVAMDEPLWFGHVSNQKNSCHSPIDAIARDVAARVAVIKEVFPDVEVGDTEPLASPAQPADWLDEISSWLAAYKQAVGTPLRFFDADLTWSGDWQPQLAALAARLRAAKVAYGVIYDGDSTDNTGEAWVRHAEDRFAQVEVDPATIPDRAILQSWTLQPAHMLPETQPGTMTYLVNSYARQKTAMTLKRENGHLSGRLVGPSGIPLAGAKIQLLLISANSARVKSPQTLTNIVPAGAKSATVALRINSECGCSGVAHLDIGQLSYRDSNSSKTIQVPWLPNPSDNDFDVLAGQTLARNSQPFQVAPGSPFTFSLSMGATAESTHSGYIALVFLGDGGQELERLRIPFSPATSDLGTVATGASGAYSASLPPGTPAAGVTFRAVFPGDTSYRPAYGSQ